MVKLGQWSFALYLLPRPVLEVVQGSAASWGLGQSIALGSLTVALLIGASAAVHEWFEKPIERRIRSWGGPRKPVARGAAIVLAPGALASAVAGRV
jgi:peptidoglycan/LPS O-acetylase OafA/YrhL